MMEIIGWGGSILFGACGLPQAYKSYVEGHARGLSHSFIWMWTGGEILTLIYVLSLPTLSWPLITNYLINLVSVIIILRYKYFERRPYIGVDIARP